MKRKNLLAIAAGLTMMAASGVYAQGYLGAGVGAGNIDVDCTGVTDCDKSNTGYKVYGGYQFGGGWAAELGYFGWGKVTGSGTLAGVGTGTGKLRATGVGVGVAYFFPVAPDWVPVVRLGIARNTGKLTATDTTNGGGSISDTTHSTQPYFGVGIGYKMMPQLFLTGEVDFSRVKYLDSEKADVRLISIGLRYAF